MKICKTVCNVCEKEFDVWDAQENYGLHYFLGYGSQRDGKSIALDMCCSCFDKLLDYLLPLCKINPIKNGGAEY